MSGAYVFLFSLPIWGLLNFVVGVVATHNAPEEFKEKVQLGVFGFFLVSSILIGLIGQFFYQNFTLF